MCRFVRKTSGRQSNVILESSCLWKKHSRLFNHYILFLFLSYSFFWWVIIRMLWSHFGNVESMLTVAVIEDVVRSLMISLNNNLSSFGPLFLFRAQSIFQCVSSMNTGWTFCFQYYANVDIAIFLASLFCSELAPFPRWYARYIAGWFIMLIIISLLSVVNCIAFWQNHVPLYCGFR